MDALRYSQKCSRSLIETVRRKTALVDRHPGGGESWETFSLAWGTSETDPGRKRGGVKLQGRLRAVRLRVHLIIFLGLRCGDSQEAFYLLSPPLFANNPLVETWGASRSPGGVEVKQGTKKKNRRSNEKSMHKAERKRPRSSSDVKVKARP